MVDKKITLEMADAYDIPTFKKELQESFALAVVDEFGSLPDGPIPSENDLDSAINAQGSVVLRVLCDGQNVGGAVLIINEQTQHNSLDLFFIRAGEHGRGFGNKAWFAIEKRYPKTKIWQTYTPYFEKRNIHFYVNKCGFRIIEFFNKFHSDPNHPCSEDFPGHDEAFRFEKIMQRD
jgi:hypothetical protein